MPYDLPDNALEIVHNLRGALDAYNKTLCGRLELFEAATDSSFDRRRYRHGYNQMMQRYGSHVHDAGAILALGEALLRWLDSYGFSVDARRVREFQAELKEYAELAAFSYHKAAIPYFIVFAALRHVGHKWYTYLLELEAVLRQKKGDWQGIPAGELDVSDALPIATIAHALGIQPAWIGKGPSTRRDWRQAHARLKGKLIRVKGTYLYRVKLRLLDPGDAQAIRDAARSLD